MLQYNFKLRQQRSKTNIHLADIYESNEFPLLDLNCIVIFIVQSNDEMKEVTLSQVAGRMFLKRGSHNIASVKTKYLDQIQAQVIKMSIMI